MSVPEVNRLELQQKQFDEALAIFERALDGTRELVWRNAVINPRAMWKAHNALHDIIDKLKEAKNEHASEPCLFGLSIFRF